MEKARGSACFEEIDRSYFSILTCFPTYCLYMLRTFSLTGRTRAQTQSPVLGIPYSRRGLKISVVTLHGVVHKEMMGIVDVIGE